MTYRARVGASKVVITLRHMIIAVLSCIASVMLKQFRATVVTLWQDQVKTPKVGPAITHHKV